MSTPAPAPALLASFVDIGFRLPEGSVVVEAAVPRHRLDDIVRGFGLPKGRDPDAEHPPLILLPAGRWPERGEPDEAVIVEAALALVDALLSDPRLPLTPRLGARLAGLLGTLTERADLRNAIEEHMR